MFPGLERRFKATKARAAGWGQEGAIWIRITNRALVRPALAGNVAGLVLDGSLPAGAGATFREGLAIFRLPERRRDPLRATPLPAARRPPSLSPPPPNAPST